MATTARRVVVGVDGSAPSAAALRWAYDQAAAWAATLDVVQSWQPPPTVATVPISGWSIDMGDLEASARALCSAQVAAAAEPPRPQPAEIRQLVVIDSPASAILEAAAGADLVVVGSRGLGGFKGLLLGSVSHQVVNHARCPVAVIRVSDEASPSTAIDGPVVVGADGSAGSIDALVFALGLAASLGAPLVAIAAWSWIDQPGEHFDPHFSETTVRTRAEEAVNAARRRVPDADVAVEVRVVNDLPARALLDAAAEGRVLVVGSRGLGGFKGLLLGSVSEQVVRHAPGPIVVIHPREAAPEGSE